MQDKIDRPRVPERFVDTQEAMRRLCVGRTKLYQFVKEGRLQLFKLYGGKRTVFRPDDIERLINETTEG